MASNAASKSAEFKGDPKDDIMEMEARKRDVAGTSDSLVEICWEMN
jgi:hypothetical protein